MVAVYYTKWPKSQLVRSATIEHRKEFTGDSCKINRSDAQTDFWLYAVSAAYPTASVLSAAILPN